VAGSCEHGHEPSGSGATGFMLREDYCTSTHIRTASYVSDAEWCCVMMSLPAAALGIPC
jgi:hypothetical protein